jgi:hypothetical protein
MLVKLCAASLVLLSLSPFTAPFSTCDLGVLLGTVNHHRQQPLAPPARPVADAAVPGSVVPTMPTRVRARHLTPVDLPVSRGVVVPIAPARSPKATLTLHCVQTSLSSILRL